MMFPSDIARYDEWLQNQGNSPPATIEWHRQLRNFIGDMLNKAWAKTRKPSEKQPAGVSRPSDVVDLEATTGVANTAARNVEPKRPHQVRIIFVWPDRHHDFDKLPVGRHGNADLYDWHSPDNAQRIITLNDGTLEELFRTCEALYPGNSPRVIYGGLEALPKHPDNFLASSVVQFREDRDVVNWLQYTEDVKQRVALCIFHRTVDEDQHHSPARELIPPPHGWINRGQLLKEIVEEDSEVSEDAENPVATRHKRRFYAPRSKAGFARECNRAARRALRNQRFTDNLRRAARAAGWENMLCFPDEATFEIKDWAAGYSEQQHQDNKELFLRIPQDAKVADAPYSDVPWLALAERNLAYLQVLHGNGDSPSTP